MKGNFLFCYKVLPRSTALQYKNSTIMVAKWNWLTIFMQVWEWLEWIYDARLRLAFRKMRESECAKVVTQVSILYQIVLPTFHIFPCILFYQPLWVRTLQCTSIQNHQKVPSPFLRILYLLYIVAIYALLQIWHLILGGLLGLIDLDKYAAQYRTLSLTFDIKIRM